MLVALEEDLQLEVLSDSVNGGFNQASYREGVNSYLKSKHVVSLIKFFYEKNIIPEIRYADLHTLNEEELGKVADDGNALKTLFHEQSSLCFDFPQFGGRVFRVRKSSSPFSYLCVDAVRDGNLVKTGREYRSNQVFIIRNNTIGQVMSFIDNFVTNV